METLNFEGMKKRWPSDYVARERVGDFTGGLIHPRTMANHDSRREGPGKKIRLGKKIAYPVDELVKWLNDRLETSKGDE